MSHLSDVKVTLVRGLIEQAPDRAIQNLLSALTSDDAHDDSLASIQSLVEIEAADRRARNTAFAPVAPLFAPSGPFSGLTFPPRTLSLLWKALKADAPRDVAAVKAQVSHWRGGEAAPELYDKLCALAASGLRCGEESFAAAASAADQGGGRAALAACLDIAPITRRALVQMPEWLGRMTGARAATLRLAYRDIVAVADDGGPRFFEMLAAHLTEPWLILRIISGVMDRPNEDYFAGSELGSFGERVLADIERRLAEVTALKATDGRQAAHLAAHALHLSTIEATELEQSILLRHDAAWGQRLGALKLSLAATVETHLKAAEINVHYALPLQTLRMGPRTLKGVPRLTHEPDLAQVEKAATLLVFMHEVRTSAAAGGFASARAKRLEAIELRLDTYVEDVLAELRDDDGIDPVRATAFLDIAAEFCGLIRDEKSAQIVRRRAAAALAA